MKKELIELRVNGRSHELAIEANKLLLDMLRQDLQLTGSKRGCDDSSCGACTVLVDGIPMLSCTLLAASCEGQEITTVEGVSEHGGLAAIQKAYGDWGGAQCGYCTPGFIMTVKHLLAENPYPSEEEARAALSGNLCRCTGYNYQGCDRSGAERNGSGKVATPLRRHSRQGTVEQDSSRRPARFWIHVAQSISFTALAIMAFHRLAVRVGVSRARGQDALATADKMPGATVQDQRLATND